jgi:prepilin-type N-terminal cleavage/methylation domain-containing protein
MKNKKAFTLIELLLAITLMGILITVVAFNFDSLWTNKYSEAKENLKTFLINHKHKATYFQKDSEIYFDDLYNLYGNFEDVYLLENITNDLKIVESSSTKIVFFLDGGAEESYIVTTSLDGTVTNTFIINAIGIITYNDGYTPLNVVTNMPSAIEE